MIAPSTALVYLPTSAAIWSEGFREMCLNTLLVWVLSGMPPISSAAQIWKSKWDHCKWSPIGEMSYRITQTMPLMGSLQNPCLVAAPKMGGQDFSPQ